MKPEQITSGTLAYAVGSGKAVISTPYWYAQRAPRRRVAASSCRGAIPQAIAGAVIELLGDDEQARWRWASAPPPTDATCCWPAVARALRRRASSARAREHAQRLRSAFQAQTLARRPLELPELNLDHLRALTDDTGILQHAIFNVPRYDDGYCLDDNARALLLVTLVEDAGTEDVAADARSCRRATWRS